MALRYRNYLILEKANLDSKSGFWNVRAHVQFNEGGIFHDVLIPCATHSFPSEKAAKKHILQKAKHWINTTRSPVAKSAGPVLVYTRGEHADHEC